MKMRPFLFQSSIAKDVIIYPFPNTRKKGSVFPIRLACSPLPIGEDCGRHHVWCGP
jgi:hypothetical protein